MADFTRAGLRPSDWWREAVRPGAEQIETITELKRLIDRLEAGESLTEDEWVSLIEGRSPELADYIFEKRAASGKESTEKRCMCGDSLSAAIIAKTTVFIAASEGATEMQAGTV